MGVGVANLGQPAGQPETKVYIPCVSRRTHTLFGPVIMGNRSLSSVGVGKRCVLPIRVPNPSPTLEIRILHPWVQEFCPVIGVEVWRKAPEEFPDSNTTLDTYFSLRSNHLGTDVLRP